MNHIQSYRKYKKHKNPDWQKVREVTKALQMFLMMLQSARISNTEGFKDGEINTKPSKFQQRLKEELEKQNKK